MKVENKIAGNNDTLATKEDLLKLQVAVEKGFNSLKIWIVGVGIVEAGLIYLLFKLFIVK